MAPKKKTTKPTDLTAAAALAAQFDRSQIGEKIRLHALAKAIGLASKELVAQFAELGVKKAPQSSVTAAEADQVLDKIQGGQDKLRDRVRKNVENEISQIEGKVEAELADATPGPEQLHAVLEDAGEDFDEDIAPVIPPKPEDDDLEYAPIFLPPQPQETPAPEQPAASRRRGSRGTSRGRGAEDSPRIEEPKAIKGSTRIEAQRRRRAELREKGRERKHIISQAEFLARRESVERTMVVRDKERRDGGGIVTQVGVLEDDLLVEHFVTTEAQPSIIGNIYLGRVQNVLPSMEAAFIDIGTGRNGVLYAGEVDWKATGSRSRRIEQALKSGDQVLVQVAKDPIGHKGARLTTQISLAGRFLVYVPGGRNAGISRKLPVPERKRLKGILERVVPDDGGAIIRTAAENVPEESIASDVRRLHERWEDITAQAEREKASKGAKPVALYEEPDLLVKVVRDLFNEDIHQLVVDGKRSYKTVRSYVESMAPELADRVERYDSRVNDGQDAFAAYRVDEQLHKALSRKVWLPSGGTLIIERTEAMTVVDVNTGKFTGSGGNLEETVTRNNLEAAEEVVRQMRLRDLGGMIVVDFIDMVLPENQELVLRRLKEALGRDRTRHQVSEVTSLGLVQMTRKRMGTGLLETFSTECEHCHGRGLIVHEYPVDEEFEESHPAPRRKKQQERQEPKEPVKPEPQTPIEDLVAKVVVEDDGDAVSDIESIAYAAAENAAESDDVEEFASYVADEPAQSAQTEQPGQSYEQAVAEFEASPRRRRRTRGNSRSDRRPQPQDFAPAADAPEEAKPQMAAPKKSKKRTADSGKRGRRRAVRKIAGTPASESAAPVEKDTRSNQGDGEVKVLRRGRKRAVKKSLRKGAAKAAQSEPASTAEVQTSSGRGRRRVARRRK